MAEAQKLNVRPRVVLGKKVNGLRRKGLLPGVVFGGRADSTPVETDQHAFELSYRRWGNTTLLSLTGLDGGEVPALIYDVSRDPVTGRMLHVDFARVSLTEKTHADVPLHFVNESPAVPRARPPPKAKSPRAPHRRPQVPRVQSPRHLARSRPLPERSPQQPKRRRAALPRRRLAERRRRASRVAKLGGDPTAETLCSRRGPPGLGRLGRRPGGRAPRREANARGPSAVGSPQMRVAASSS